MFLMWYNYHCGVIKSRFDTSDSNTSKETLITFEPVNPVSTTFLSDTEVILDSSPGLSGKNLLRSAPLVSEKNSKFVETEYTVQTSSKSEKLTSSKLL